MKLRMGAVFSWYFAVKWLHDALLEDCLDKVQNRIGCGRASSPHNPWVTLLRKILKRRK
jgi:hypothetical protein